MNIPNDLFIHILVEEIRIFNKENIFKLIQSENFDKAFNVLMGESLNLLHDSNDLGRNSYLFESIPNHKITNILQLMPEDRAISFVEKWLNTGDPTVYNIFISLKTNFKLYNIFDRYLEKNKERFLSELTQKLLEPDCYSKPFPSLLSLLIKKTKTTAAQIQYLKSLLKSLRKDEYLRDKMTFLFEYDHIPELKEEIIKTAFNFGDERSALEIFSNKRIGFNYKDIYLQVFEKQGKKQKIKTVLNKYNRDNQLFYSEIKFIHECYISNKNTFCEKFGDELSYIIKKYDESLQNNHLERKFIENMHLIFESYDWRHAFFNQMNNILNDVSGWNKFLRVFNTIDTLSFSLMSELFILYQKENTEFAKKFIDNAVNSLSQAIISNDPSVGHPLIHMVLNFCTKDQCSDLKKYCMASILSCLMTSKPSRCVDSELFGLNNVRDSKLLSIESICHYLDMEDLDIEKVIKSSMLISSEYDAGSIYKMIEHNQTKMDIQSFNIEI